MKSKDWREHVTADFKRDAEIRLEGYRIKVRNVKMKRARNWMQLVYIQLSYMDRGVPIV